MTSTVWIITGEEVNRDDRKYIILTQTLRKVNRSLENDQCHDVFINNKPAERIC